jgi:hypothetical protein
MNRNDVRATPMGFGTEPTEVARTPSTTYCVLNSADRFVNSQPGQVNTIVAPYNDFRLQKPQALLDAFARRIQVSEVRFPWYIPNILPANSYFLLFVKIDGITTPIKVNIPAGFYEPAALAAAITTDISNGFFAAGLPSTEAPLMTYSSYQFRLVTPPTATDTAYALASPSTPFPAGPAYGDPMTPYQYQTSASLLRTLGFNVGALTFNYASPNFSPTGFRGQFTTCLYTDYIDIVSNKFNSYADVRDGASGLNTSSSLVCRIYAADECSITSPQPIGTAPFVIHRQFKTPKSVQWNPEAFLDWLDISVFDQYGKLIDMSFGEYPDFQITLIASES